VVVDPGPALASIGPNPSESVLAWTDPSFHLDVATSSDGLHFANKLTLDETSPFRPDVAIASAGGPIMLAWVGTDPHHSLNVLYDVYGSHPAKLTLPQDQSFAPPALLYGPSFFLAWTGTDANHSLNILPLRVTPSVTPSLETGPTTVLSQLGSLVIAGPHLRRNSATVIALDWTSPSLQPEIATSTDGVRFGTGTVMPELTTYAPDTYSLAPFSPPPSGPVREWVGWTGFDAAHHLNVQWTTNFPSFSDQTTTRTVLSDTALGGPALAYNGGNQIAWTGTDPYHHLNIATFA
jgi:hypothetical protein